MDNNTNSSRKKIRFLYFVFGVSLAAIIFCAAGLALELYTKGQGQAYYAALSMAQNTDRYNNTTNNMANNITTEMPDVNNIIGTAIYEVTPVVFEETPYVPYVPHVPSVDFDPLKEMFPDIVAWISSPGTVIDYPVMQANDNCFYLSRLPDGTHNKMGSIFLDYRNSADFSDSNILIYGHDMNSGDMFGTLRNYANQSFYEEHYRMFIYTPERDYELILFAGYILDSSVETPPMGFRSEEAFDDYIADIKQRSIFISDVTASYGDRLVFLCTCTGRTRDERLIIVGKLVPYGHKAAINNKN